MKIFSKRTGTSSGEDHKTTKIVRREEGAPSTPSQASTLRPWEPVNPKFQGFDSPPGRF